MDTLEQARQEIDAVDAQLAALFERRMRAVVQVAQYKKAHGLPIHDPAREEQVLQKAADRIEDPALRPYYLDHVRNRMALARQYEALLLGQNRVAYQGVEGAFAHIALRELFPHAEAVSCPTWDEVFAKVSAGDAAYGVVPFENSHAGDVSAVLDLCYKHTELWVVQVYDLPVRQNLLVLPGASLTGIRHVYSHQQAISQSETFLKQMRLPCTAMDNTAMAAKFVAESGDHGRQIRGRKRGSLQGGHRQPGDRGPLRAGSAGARHQHRRRQHHPLHRHQPGKAHPRQPLFPPVHVGQQARQAGCRHPEDRRLRLQHGVHQKPAHAPYAL